VRSTWALVARHRDFRRLLLANVVSLIGDWFSYVAVASLVTDLTGRPGAAAYVYAAGVLPVFLAAPFAGTIADRFDRRRTLIIVDLARVPVAAALCLAAAWGSAPLAIALTVAIAVGASFADPIANAATPNLVPAEDLAHAQAVMGAVWGSMLLVGAGAGGVVADLLGRSAAFAIDAASFAVSAYLIATIRRPLQEPRRPATPADTSVREALAFIRREPRVLRMVFAKVGASLANGIVGLLPAFAAARFPGRQAATGALLAARGLGAMLGPILARRAIGPAAGRRAVVLVCGISTLSYCACYALLPLVHGFVAAVVLVIGAHLGGGAQWAMSTFALQRDAPDHVRGRVLSIDYGLATLAIGGSSIAAGAAADALGTAPATWLLAAIGTAYGLAWLAWSLPTARDA
jgi:MFS family permease